MALGIVNTGGEGLERLVVLFSVDDNDIVADKTHAEILEENSYGNPVFAHCPTMSAYNIPLVYANVQMAVFSLAFVKLGVNTILTIVVKSDDTVEVMEDEFSTKEELDEAVAQMQEALSNMQESLSGIQAVAIGDRTDIPEGTDLNTLTTPGCYRVPTVLLAASLVNLPEGFDEQNFLLDVLKYNSAGYITQRAYPVSDAFCAVRNWRGGNEWSDWDISYSNNRMPELPDLGVTMASIAKFEVDEEGVLRPKSQLAEVGGEGAELDGYATESFVRTAISEHDSDSTAHEDLRQLANDALNAAENHDHPASEITAGTFAATDVKAATGTDYSTYRVRNAAILSAVPSSMSNGDIAFVYS